MNWLLFQYTLPRDHKNRVTLWRRIKKLGAISPIQGTHILPDTPDCLESLHWLMQTVKEDGGTRCWSTATACRASVTMT